jgi:hypothetical protein
MGSIGCFGWIVRLVFFGLLWHGRDELGPRWILGLVLAWLAGWGLSLVIPGGPAFFISLTAILDIVLVLVIFKGDIRLT